jgi:3-hydroxyisobutyrate dehydrogenase-like beta-hydroxyacid dehydrogenase
MSTTVPTLGWLGTGRMGAAMAGRLIDAGHEVALWNRTKAKATPLAERGGRSVETIHQLAACDIVFVMVTTPEDLEEVVDGPAGLLSAPVKPSLVVDCSTVSVESSARVRAAAAAAGVALLAAPISGNPHVVAAGEACMVVSGPAAAFDMAKPFLDEIAKVAVYAGEDEQSRLVKLCTNLYLGMMAQALVEVIVLAEKGGTDRAAFLDFLNATVLGSEWVRRRTPELVKAEWILTFTTELLRKDFELGLASARDLEVPMPIASAVHELIQSAIGRGLRDQDFLALYDLQARDARLEPSAGQPRP